MENHKGVYDGWRTPVSDDEVILQGAHDLIYICMGQFVVDYKIWPSELQFDAIKLFYEEKKMYELIEIEGPEKATRGRVNESQSKFLIRTWPISQNQPESPLF
jgi:hypothetical protein